MADELQETGELHRHQFGVVKGRSAVDAVVRLTTRAQHALARGMDIAATFKDVKRAFSVTGTAALLKI